MDNLTDSLTVAEYFAGIGLVRMGLESWGWRVIFANDISDKKYEMYKVFFSDADQHYILSDIFDIDVANVPQTLLATCSFPCVDLSIAGKMDGIGGKHSSAFWGFINILKMQDTCAPSMILVENVPGWLYSNNGEDFRLTVEALNTLGYACDVFTLDALHFTPQSRLRVFLIGTKFPMPPYNIFLTCQRSRALLTSHLKKSLIANQNLRWFNTLLPEPPPLKKDGLSMLIEAMDETDPRWWTEEEVQRHFKMMNTAHHQMVTRLINNSHITYRTFYRRIREGQQRAEVRHDDIAGCLRTAIGGSGKQFVLKAGNGKLKMRTLTAREYARLQGVPDTYPITVNGVQALTGFGDAVCVPVIQWIAEHALHPLINKYLSKINSPQGNINDGQPYS